MADLTEQAASLAVKLTGSSLAGVESNYVNVDSSGNMFVVVTSAGPVTPGTVATNSDLIGGQFNTALPTLTNGQQSAIQLDSSGRLIIVGTISLPIGAATSALQTTGNTSLASILSALTLAQGSTTSGQTGNLNLAAVTTGAPTYVTGQSSPLSLTTAGALRTDSSATTQPVSGTVTSNQGTAQTVANGWPVKITDGTDSANISSNNDLQVTDILNVSAVYGTVSITTTASELKVGGSVLANRKYIIIQPRANNLYIGFNSSVTTANGMQVFKNQLIMIPVGPNVHVYAISDQASGIDTRIEELS